VRLVPELTGRLCSKPPPTMLNEVAFRGDWYATGDRAIKDADISWFVGRADDVIKTSATASVRSKSSRH